MPGSDDEQREAQTARQATCELIDKVTNGGRPAPSPLTVTVRPGEYQYGALVVEAHAFYDVTVEYTAGDHHRSDGPLFAGTGRAAEAIRDASMHRRAEREAAAQWRSVGVVPCAITSRRLLIRDGERQWQAYPLDTLVSLTPDVQTSALELAFENSASVRLRGPWVPWLTVVISTLQFARPWPPGFPLPTGDGPR